MPSEGILFPLYRWDHWGSGQWSNMNTITVSGQAGTQTQADLISKSFLCGFSFYQVKVSFSGASTSESDSIFWVFIKGVLIIYLTLQICSHDYTGLLFWLNVTMSFILYSLDVPYKCLPCLVSCVSIVRILLRLPGSGIWELIWQAPNGVESPWSSLPSTDLCPRPLSPQQIILKFKLEFTSIFKYTISYLVLDTI